MSASFRLHVDNLRLYDLCDAMSINLQSDTTRIPPSSRTMINPYAQRLTRIPFSVDCLERGVSIITIHELTI
jgi:hypothetical protein